MSKREIIRDARELFNVTARYSGNEGVLYFSGEKAHAAKAKLKVYTSIPIEIGYAPRVARVKKEEAKA